MSEQPLSPAQQQQAVDALYMYAAQQMQSGVSARRLEDDLKQRGLPQDVASAVVRNLKNARTSALREAGVRDLGIGFLLMVVGCGITYATFSAAEGGGTYVVLWGLIFIGAAQVLRGLVRLMGFGG